MRLSVAHVNQQLYYKVNLTWKKPITTWATEYSGDNTPVVEEDYADNLQEAE